MKQSMIFLAEGLKKAREKKGISQRELSVKTGITQSQISKFENCSVDLQLSTLIELSRGLEMELMLIPRNLVPTIEALQKDLPPSTPKYRLDDEDENNE